MILRKATVADTDKIALVHNDIVGILESETETKGKEFHDLRSREELENLLSNENSVVVEVNGSVVAYSLFAIYGNVLIGSGAGVSPIFRGQGLQLKMYQHIIEHSNFELEIVCMQKNKASLRNIIKAGLVKVKERKSVKGELEYVFELKRNK